MMYALVYWCLQDAQQCLQLLQAAAARAGLLSASRHPHWPKACQRLGDALAGLTLHQQVSNTTSAPSGLHCRSGTADCVLHGNIVKHITLPRLGDALAGLTPHQHVSEHFMIEGQIKIVQHSNSLADPLSQ
jgi:hypothetical protein